MMKTYSYKDKPIKVFGVVDFEIFHNTVDILIDSFCVV